MRLALVRQRYTSSGGAERFVERALEALQSREVTLTLITRNWREQPQLAVHRCNPFYLGRLWRDWSFARCVSTHIHRQHYDLVQSHERIADCDIYRAGDGVHREWLKLRARTLNPLARWAQTINPYHRFVLHAEKTLFHSPKLRAVICNSHYIKQQIATQFDIAPDKLHVIHSGIDTSKYNPSLKTRYRSFRDQWHIGDDVTLLLFVGSGFQRKGLKPLLQALAQMPERMHLAVVGRDKALTRYQQYARRLGLEKRVHFAGAVDDVRPYYGSADAFALPTLYDPLPNVVLEAMACALPTLASTSCGAVDFIEDGQNGYLCDASDVATIAQRLNGFLDGGTRSKLGNAAYDTVKTLTMDKMTQALIDLYAQLLAYPAHMIHTNQATDGLQRQT